MTAKKRPIRLAKAQIEGFEDELGCPLTPALLTALEQHLTDYANADRFTRKGSNQSRKNRQQLIATAEQLLELARKVRCE